MAHTRSSSLQEVTVGPILILPKFYPPLRGSPGAFGRHLHMWHSMLTPCGIRTSLAGHLI